MKRIANAVWNGSLKGGSGKITTQSAVLNNTKYDFNSRFGYDKSTNPEELLAAAHAGCFAMALSLILGKAGFTADSLEVTSMVTKDPDKLQLGYSAEGDHVIPWQTEHVFSWRTSTANAVSAFQS
jgi:osmotically inducible protein OsmC